MFSSGYLKWPILLLEDPFKINRTLPLKVFLDIVCIGIPFTVVFNYSPLFSVTAYFQSIIHPRQRKRTPELWVTCYDNI